VISKNLKTNKELLQMEITENDRNSYSIIIILNGNMIEHVYKPNLSACLKSKRIASRELILSAWFLAAKLLKPRLKRNRIPSMVLEL